MIMKNYLLHIYLITFTIIFTQNNEVNNEPTYIPAYDFSLTLYDEMVNDSIITLSSFKGDVVLLNFWATWCGPCIAEIPEFNDLYEKYNSKGFEIIGVSISDNFNQLKKFTNKINVDYKLLYGSTNIINEVIQQYGGFYSVPVSYLINRDGLVVRGYPGAIIGDYWTSLLVDDIKKFISIPATSSDSTKVIEKKY
tara:strand:+ start:193 stop:777 length:585 start_codon:yes stop_codon:yes gene_type:complete